MSSYDARTRSDLLTVDHLDHLDQVAEQIRRDGLARLDPLAAALDDVWHVAVAIAARVNSRDQLAGCPAGLEVVGKFTVPPPGVAQRDFQALHIDFGVPAMTAQAAAVSVVTALYVDPDLPPSGAVTRVVPLRRLLSQRDWPPRQVVAERLRHRAGQAAVEGILARLVEASDQSTDLPCVDGPGFMCGMEFATIEDEHHFFAEHGLDVASVEVEIALAPGELLVFDNLAVVHGRRGPRNAGELHQLCVGFSSVDGAGQQAVLNRILDAFPDAYV